MPARKISPQSFDDILSDLGDDPAIPDPHGIRKPNSPKRPDWDAIGATGTPGTPQSKPKIQLNFQNQIPQLESLKKTSLILGTGGLLIASGAALFFTFSPIQSEQNIHIEGAQQDIAALKKELALLREEIQDSEDAIYEAIDLIEVSVHSLEKNRPQTTTKPKLPSIPFETELRRWRYLGVSQSAGTYRAFFHNGKTTLMVEMGGLLLGEWRLSNADKEAATATHHLGKSLILKVAISE
ncbi:hypothetical protein DCO17_00495 [Polynucleobacter tropicus]|uniref:Uncharacterized protein n=1 Tax=Polynucleobacter tropicus TaxID=1743174 RepID=A0A6M9PXY4_9BURK|nr:hypothetical protein [Polynucleobacter tropicus]QKM63837.1 hypothetical protein DCO17_00495 [Polynucleobacter tropicus]